MINTGDLVLDEDLYGKLRQMMISGEFLPVYSAYSKQILARIRLGLYKQQLGGIKSLVGVIHWLFADMFFINMLEGTYPNKLLTRTYADVFLRRGSVNAKSLYFCTVHPMKQRICTAYYDNNWDKFVDSVGDFNWKYSL